jgi:hypothetical protein
VGSDRAADSWPRRCGRPRDVNFRGGDQRGTLPDTFRARSRVLPIDCIELAAFCRQWHERDVGRDDERVGPMPPD